MRKKENERESCKLVSSDPTNSSDGLPGRMHEIVEELPVNVCPSSGPKPWEPSGLWCCSNLPYLLCAFAPSFLKSL